eukprot:COSAG06_NODE_42889_length_377_cov_0.928058_1_plen_75_part_10
MQQLLTAWPAAGGRCAETHGTVVRLPSENPDALHRGAEGHLELHDKVLWHTPRHGRSAGGGFAGVAPSVGGAGPG